MEHNYGSSVFSFAIGFYLVTKESISVLSDKYLHLSLEHTFLFTHLIIHARIHID